MKETKTRWLDLWGREISAEEAEINRKSTAYGKGAVLEEDGVVNYSADINHPNCINRIRFADLGPSVYERCTIAITILAYKYLISSYTFDLSLNMIAYQYYVKGIDLIGMYGKETGEQKMQYIKICEEVAKDFVNNKDRYIREYLDSDEYKTKKREHKMIRDKMTSRVLAWS